MSWRQCPAVALAAALLCGSAIAAENAAENSSDRVGQVRGAIAERAYGSAITQLRSLQNELGDVDDASLRAETRSLLSEIYLQLGNLRGVEQQLPTTLELEEMQSAEVLRSLGTVYTQLGAFDDALAALDASVRTAQALDDQTLLVELLNQRAMLKATLSETDASVRDLEAALDYAPDASRTARDLELNILRIRAEQQRSAELLIRIATFIEARAGTLDPAQIVTLADIGIDVSADMTLPAALRDALRAEVARLPSDGELTSYRHGLDAELLRLAGDHPAALRAARRALIAAQAAGRPEVSYRWEWLLARLHRDAGNLTAALAASEDSISSLAEVQTELITGNPYRFRSTVGDVYFDHADILLQVAAASTPDARPQYLRAARAAVERLKVAEIQDYLGNECTRGLSGTGADTVATDVAVVYPIVFRDRVELLVSSAGSIQRFVSPLTRASLTDSVNIFRELLQDYTVPEDEIITLAVELYKPLIAPWIGTLPDAVKTLVFVPDDILRTIPMGALHDGEQFLIERFDVAITPGLALTDSSTASANVRAYVGGVSLEREVNVGRVQSRRLLFKPLDSVPAEVATISGLYATSAELDEPFLTATLENNLASGDYSVVHIASHGVFGRDPQASFILTWDRFLSMNRLGATLGLRRYSGEPLDLLVLSACETAVGDERAALGLAGVAVGAGARSAVASLWEVNDAATGRLMADFYTGMRTNSLEKARALSQAKQNLLADPVYSHPAFWAPFLLIGNWR